MKVNVKKNLLDIISLFNTYIIAYIICAVVHIFKHNYTGGQQERSYVFMFSSYYN